MEIMHPRPIFDFFYRESPRSKGAWRSTIARGMTPARPKSAVTSFVFHTSQRAANFISRPRRRPLHLNFLIMVKVQIVDEKEETNSVYASSSSSRTGSTDSLESTISEPEAETFMDRVAALVDIVPPTTRYSIKSKVSKTFSVVKGLGKFTGNVVWVVTTSALLVGLPLALSLEDEAKIVAQEKEMLAPRPGPRESAVSGATSLSCIPV